MRRQHKEKKSREKHLNSLIGKEITLWKDIENLLLTKQPKQYDQAVKILLDLRDLAAHEGPLEFNSRIATLRQTHARKPAFIERLRKKGL